MNSVAMTVRELKSQFQDFEWYETSPKILETIEAYIQTHDIKTDPMLDIGAGRGNVLMKLGTGSKYAIEKSQLHINAMPRSINIIETQFEEQSLIDKRLG
jgi:hypothetical protein